MRKPHHPGSNRIEAVRGTGLFGHATGIENETPDRKTAQGAASLQAGRKELCTRVQDAREKVSKL